MALTGVEIFKLLPKTNCKKCGFPTCLAFAMKLAQRQASLDLCPDVSEEAKQKLGEASAPPVKPTTLGSGDLAVKMGEEITIALPYLDDKRNGLIVWCNSDGFGVKLAQPHEETVSPARLYRRISSRVIGLFR